MIKRLVFLLALCPILIVGNEYQLSINSGEIERKETIVNFDWPHAEDSHSGLYANEDGTILVRVRKGQASFILNYLEPNKVLKVKVSKLDPKKSIPGVEAKQDQGKIKFIQKGKLNPLEYFVEAQFPRDGIDKLYLRSGYLHPIRTPSGIVVSDDYPEKAHTHHHGIWFPWTKTKFEGREPDFWNMGNGKGRVEHTKLLSHWSGPVHAGLSAKHVFVDMIAQPEKKVLEEEWNVKFYAVGADQNKYHSFDLVSEQTNITNSKFTLPQYRYGGLGFRGLGEWDGEENCYFLTSNGETDRIKAHTTRANWCHIGGKSDNKWVGIAILGHPDNFRSPQPMRVHPTEPFFNFAPSQAGDWDIKPGETYVSKYRFIVSDGKPDSKFIDRLWLDYSNPPQVEVSPLDP